MRHTEIHARLHVYASLQVPYSSPDAGSKSTYLLQVLLVAVEGTGHRELALVEKRVEFIHADSENVPIGIQRSVVVVDAEDHRIVLPERLFHTGNGLRPSLACGICLASSIGLGDELIDLVLQGPLPVAFERVSGHFLRIEQIVRTPANSARTRWDHTTYGSRRRENVVCMWLQW